MKIESSSKLFAAAFCVADMTRYDLNHALFFKTDSDYLHTNLHICNLARLRKLMTNFNSVKFKNLK